MHKRFTYACLSLPALGMLMLSACAPSTSATPSPSPMIEATRTGGLGTPEVGMMETPMGNVPVTGAEIDELFIDMMVPHHQGAVVMAQIALDRSQTPEIQEMANAIITSQEEEIAQMKAWKQAWYGTSDTPELSEMPMLEAMPGMGGMGHTMNMQADVDALRNATEPFDLAFIDAMIPHHQSAIEAAEVVMGSAVHPEIRELAQGVIEEQHREIDQMLEWRQAWFPDVSPLPSGTP